MNYKVGDRVRINIDKTDCPYDWGGDFSQIFTITEIENPPHYYKDALRRFRTKECVLEDGYVWWFDGESAEVVRYELPEELFTL